MKSLLMVALVLACATGVAVAQSSQYVPGYFRADGTYVPGYYRTVPDNSPYNNYSTRGNVNPYTGRPGYVNPPSPQPRVQLQFPDIAGNAMRAYQQGQEMRLRQLEMQRLQQETQRNQQENSGGPHPYWVLSPPSSGG